MSAPDAAPKTGLSPEPLPESDERQDPVVVAVRIRPMAPYADRASCVVRGKQMLLRMPMTEQNPIPRSLQFSFDRIFDERASQQDVYDRIGRPLADHAMQGFSSCCFAYGQTGSGKTYSMYGDESIEHRGIIPRLVMHLLSRAEQVNQSGTGKVKLTCQFLELYNDNIRDLGIAYTYADLLNVPVTSAKCHELRRSRPPFTRGGPGDPLWEYERQSLEIMDYQQGQGAPATQGGQGSTFVRGLTEIDVDQLDEILDIIAAGVALRTTKETNLNQASSRSHTVFTITVTVSMSKQAPIVGRINMVDLAGSERIKKSHSEGQRFKEAVHINTSLSALAKVVLALSQLPEKPDIHVPYRDSKLTRVLKDSLAGNALITVIANIDLSKTNVDESVNTLYFAQRCKSIKATPMAGITGASEQDTADYIEELEGIILKLQGQVDDLGAELEDAVAEVEGVHAHYQKVMESMQAGGMGAGADVLRTKLVQIAQQARDAAKGAGGRPKGPRPTASSAKRDDEFLALEERVRDLEREVEGAQEALAQAMERAKKEAAARVAAEKDAVKARTRQREEEADHAMASGRMQARIVAMEEEQGRVKTLTVEAIRRATETHVQEIARLRRENDKLAERLAQLAAMVPTACDLRDHIAAQERTRRESLEASLSSRQEAALKAVHSQYAKVVSDLEAKTQTQLTQKDKEYQGVIAQIRAEKTAVGVELRQTRDAAGAIARAAEVVGSLLHQSLSLHRHLTPQAQSLLSSLTSLSEGDPLDCHARALSAASTAAAMRPAIAEAIAATALVRPPSPPPSPRRIVLTPGVPTHAPGTTPAPTPADIDRAKDRDRDANRDRGAASPGGGDDGRPSAGHAVLSELASLPTVQYIRGLEEDVKRYREKLKEERRQKRELQVALEAARRRDSQLMPGRGPPPVTEGRPRTAGSGRSVDVDVAKSALMTMRPMSSTRPQTARAGGAE